MEHPLLEKSILAKMPFPHEVQILIKKYLQVPTPTARLMKQVSITQFGNWTYIGGIGVRVYELSGRWSAPPLRPEIQYSHTYRKNYVNYWQPLRWNTSTGELIVARRRRVRLTWPVLLGPENLPTWDYWTREEADEMARRVRSWTPVSI